MIYKNRGILALAVVLIGGLLPAATAATTPAASKTLANVSFKTLDLLNVTDAEAYSLLGPAIQINASYKGSFAPATTPAPADAKSLASCIGAPTPIWASWGVAKSSRSSLYVLPQGNSTKLPYLITLNSLSYPTYGDGAAQAARVVGAKSCLAALAHTSFVNFEKSLNLSSSGVVTTASVVKNAGLPAGSYAVLVESDQQLDISLTMAEKVLYVMVGKGNVLARYRLEFNYSKNSKSEADYAKVVAALVKIISSNAAKVDGKSL